MQPESRTDTFKRAVVVNAAVLAGVLGIAALLGGAGMAQAVVGSVVALAVLALPVVLGTAAASALVSPPLGRLGTALVCGAVGAVIAWIIASTYMAGVDRGPNPSPDDYRPTVAALATVLIAVASAVSGGIVANSGRTRSDAGPRVAIRVATRPDDGGSPEGR